MKEGLKFGIAKLKQLFLDGVQVTATAAEINTLHGATAGTAVASKAVVLDANKKISGIEQIIMGTSASPRVLATDPGASVHGIDIAITHSAGAGDCDYLTGEYIKTNVIGAGDAGLNSTALALRSYVGSDTSNAVASQSYGIQSFAKKSGTGAIDAMSAGSFKLMATDGAVQATNSINAGHFHVSGGTEEGYTPASGVTSPNFDGVMVEVYPDVVDLDSGLHVAIDAGAAVDAGIRITGAPACELKLSSGAKIFTGSAADENAVYAAVGTIDATGSIYISTAGAFFIQVANNGADADWQKVTATHT